MTSFVQTEAAPNGFYDQLVTDIDSTAGNTLVAYVSGWTDGDTEFTITSITDSTAGTETPNTWTFSLAANGSYDEAQDTWGGAYVACCIGAKAVTSVTVNLSGLVAYVEGGVSEFDALPAGSKVLATGGSGTLESGVTSYTVPAVTATSSEPMLAVAAMSSFSGWSAASAGWSIVSYEDPDGAYALAAESGSVSVTVTGSSQDVPSSAILLIGVPAVTPPATNSGALLAVFP